MCMKMDLYMTLFFFWGAYYCPVDGSIILQWVYFLQWVYCKPAIAVSYILDFI